MAMRTEEPPFRRLLILVDPATGDRPSLIAATSLAARLGAELEVLFVEDTDLMALMELPAVRQLAPPAGPNAAPTPAELRAAVLARRRRLQQEAAALASAQGVRSIFRAIRASLRAELPAAAAAADLIIVERAARPLGRMIRIKAPALRAVHGVVRPVLVLDEGLGETREVLVVVSEAVEERAITVAAHIAAAGGARLEVWVAARAVGGAPSPLRRVERLLADLAADLPAPPRLVPAAGPLEAVLRPLREGRLVVLDWSDERAARAGDWRLVEEARCSVLVLR